MPLVSELELPEFDYTDPELRGERFHRVMRDLRAQHWLAVAPLGYFVLDREAVHFFLRNRGAVFPARMLAEMFEVHDGPLHEEIERNILHIDGDDHRRLRNLVNPAFTPRAADRYRPAMRHNLERLFDAVEAAGSCEFVSAFARPYPSLMIATVMGAPLEDAERLGEWSGWIQRQFSADLLEQRPKIEGAVAEFYEWADALLARRRAAPGDDLISTLVAAEEDGDRLSDVELVNLVLNVLVGGVDTTQSQLSHAIALLATHPEQWTLLVNDPGLAPQAVEEVLRYQPIVPFTARVTLEDVEYRGVTFPEGTVVMVSAFDGNRDAGLWPDPEGFDITRKPGGPRTLTFGTGIHNCLGANLARAELEEALAFLARRMPDLELATDPVHDSINGIYGIEDLRIRFGAA